MSFGLVLKELDERARERGGGVYVATMTIVVFFEDASIGSLARDRIHTLAAKHPSRVILFDGTQNDALHHVEGEDWIELGAKGSRPRVLRGALNTLRMPEAPVYCYGSQRESETTIGSANFHATREPIVYNSSLVDPGDAALRQLVEYVGRHPELSIADIAYLRLAPWQESVAILFDGEAVLRASGSRRASRSHAAPTPKRCICWDGLRAAWAGNPRRGDSCRPHRVSRSRSRLVAKASLGGLRVSRLPRRARASWRR